MQKKLDECADSIRADKPRRIVIEAPRVVPFSLPAPAHPRPRSIYVEAAVCFFATALGSLSPQALSLFDLAPHKAVLGRVDPQSGKFLDRVLVGGLQPISFDDADAAPAPAFTAMQPLASEAPAYAARQKPVAARPAKEAVMKRAEKPAAAPHPAEAAPVPAPHAEMDAAAPEARPEPAEQGVLAALTPASLSAKLAPVGQKVVSGAKSLGGAVASGLGWLGYW